MENTAISLTELIRKAKKHLSLLGYAKGTKNHYSRNWKYFLKYADQRGHKHFSKKLGKAFLDDYHGIKPGIKLSSSQVFKVRTINVLADMLENNCFLRCYQKQGTQASPQFHVILKKYGKMQSEKNKSKRTIQGKKIILVRFLNFLNEQRIMNIEAITSYEVLSYLDTLKEYRSTTRSGIMFTLRDFLSFLHSEGHIKSPLNNLFPLIFTNKYERLPSYYSSEEIHEILCQIDRDTMTGRRDHLILVLAVQFGMRAGDIRQLKFKNIKWSRNTIELVQQKTKKLLQLPVTEEFKYALADYMKNSRPNVDDQHIFIRHRAPIEPFARSNVFHYVITKYMVLAGVNIKNRKHGLHSMRHSTASNLLRNRTPYPVITGILGHENASTTKLYLRIDIQQLRTVALEVPNEK